MSEHFQFLKEGLTADLVNMVMTDYHMDIEDALDAVYSSELFSKLSDPTTGLYLQGAIYVYSYLKDELSKGRLA